MLQRGRPRILGCKKYTSKVCDMMLKVFDRYMAGGTLGSIMKDFNLSKAGASTYLSRIEEAVGFPIVRQRRPTAKLAGSVQVARHGLKKVNQRGFHAFRASWVTIALTAGVPVDLVRKVTGHTTVEMVLTNYFQPGREDFRKTIMSAMPELLIAPTAVPALPAGTEVRDQKSGEYGEQATPAAMARAAVTCLEAMTAKNWEAKRDEALKSLRRATEWLEGRMVHEEIRSPVEVV